MIILLRSMRTREMLDIIHNVENININCEKWLVYKKKFNPDYKEISTRRKSIEIREDET